MIRYSIWRGGGDLAAVNFLHPYLRLAGRIVGEVRQSPAVRTEGGIERAHGVVRNRARLTARSRNRPDAPALFAHRRAVHESDLLAARKPDGIANQRTRHTADGKFADSFGSDIKRHD